MSEDGKAFACPKCARIIEYGKNPCPHCGMPIAWQGIEQPIDPELKAMIAEATASVFTPTPEAAIASTVTAVPMPTATVAPMPTAAEVVVPAEVAVVAPAEVAVVAPAEVAVAAPETPVVPVVDVATVPIASAVAAPIAATVAAPVADTTAAPITAAVATPVASAVAAPIAAAVSAPVTSAVAAPVADTTAAYVAANTASPKEATTAAYVATTTAIPVATTDPVAAPAPNPLPTVMPPAPMVGIDTGAVQPAAAEISLTTQKDVLPASVRKANAKSSYRKGKGVKVLANTFKAAAIVTWILMLPAIISSVFIIIDGITNFTLDGLAIELSTNETVTAAGIGIVAGFVLFGIGEIMILLNDIRRNTR